MPYQNCVYFFTDIVSMYNVVIICSKVYQNSEFDTMIMLCDVYNFTGDISFTIDCVIEQCSKLKYTNNNIVANLYYRYPYLCYIK